jgi:hypothetical protein
VPHFESLVPFLAFLTTTIPALIDSVKAEKRGDNYLRGGPIVSFPYQKKAA